MYPSKVNEKKVRQYFGTDGIRGKVGQDPITPEFILKLGWAVGRVLSGSENKRILIGKDTRISGYMLESALEAGLSAAGVNIYLLGPIPTPAIAYLTSLLEAHVGIVISASHNPYDDNGIKFFSNRGTKPTDQFELAIEEQLNQTIHTVNSENLGKAHRIEDAKDRYLSFCRSTTPKSFRLNGLKIVLDCANGATYQIAPQLFSELGANLTVLNAAPNGFNINMNCGSTHLATLKQAVLLHKAELGIAFDGDGDRVLMVDHKGEEVNGDELLFLLARDGIKNGTLKGGVVGTTMSNFGLELALKDLGLSFVRTSVGDRYVHETLQEKDWQLGGEASGHIISRHFTTTGDGIIIALQVLFAIQATGQSLHEAKKGMIKFPQVLINIPVKTPQVITQIPAIKKAVQQAENELTNGRVLLRPSGTEPVIRIMVEGENTKQIQTIAEQLAQIVKANPIATI